MHVASTIIFEGPPPRLRGVPRPHRLAPAPGPALPPEAALRAASARAGRSGSTTPTSTSTYHVRHTSLPSPGTEEQLRNLAARIFSQQLDRSKPLWELWLVEGLEGGRFAIVGKSHHCLVDGVSGVDITTVLFDLEKDPDRSMRVRPGALAAQPRADRAQLLAEALLERAHQPARDRSAAFGAVLRGPRQAARRLTDGAGRRRSVRLGRHGGARALPSTSRSARTGASPSSAPPSTTSSRSRTSTAAPSTTSSSPPSPARCGNYLRARGHATDGARDAGDGPGQRPHRRAARARSATRSRR